MADAQNVQNSLIQLKIKWNAFAVLLDFIGIQLKIFARIVLMLG